MSINKSDLIQSMNYFGKAKWTCRTPARNSEHDCLARDHSAIQPKAMQVQLNHALQFKLVVNVNISKNFASTCQEKLMRKGFLHLC